MGPSERDAVGAYSDHGDTSRTKAADLPGESLAAGAELIVWELRGSRGGARYEVGDADFLVEQQFLFPRLKQSLSEAGAVQRGPEPVAGPGKVMTRSRGVEAGIDAAEEHL
jgi:hypothetical protein